MHLRHVRLASAGQLPAAARALHDEAAAACPWANTSPAAWVLATREGLPVGLCGWRADETVAVLGPVYVRPGLRHLGLGGALVARALADLRARGVRQVEACGRPGCEAGRRLFTSAGFAELGPDVGYAGEALTRWARRRTP